MEANKCSRGSPLAHAGSALLTDERLRAWLDGNQPQRERLCLALLALDRRYTQVTPRRPRGGPDGGRDFEGVFEGRSQIWGSVGFRNGARDSTADKRWVRAKFTSDLQEAKKHNSVLDHFVFFTNIDLTPGEVGRLQSLARASGIVVCDIYYRERMRMLLDSPEGLAVRYQYLGIEMSSAEQAAFFARFGDALQSVLAARLDEVDRKLTRIEFHTECSRPTRYIAVSFRLRRALRSEDVHDLRVLVVAVSETQPEPHPTLCLTVTAGQDDLGSTSSEVKCFKSDVTIWSGEPLTRVLSGGQVETFAERERLSFGLVVEPISGFSRVADFDRLWLHLYVSRGTLDSVKTIELVVNGYAIARSEFEDLSFDPVEPDDRWLERCFDERGRTGMLENVDGPTIGTTLSPIAFTNFAEYPGKRTDD